MNDAEAHRRERIGRGVGIAVAAVAMAGFATQIGWPAPGISIALGFGAYLLVRRSSSQSGD